MNGGRPPAPSRDRERGIGAGGPSPSRRAFPRIGLTDAGILSLAGREPLVLTDDFRFSNFLAAADADYINFNHIRLMGW